ncbi:MAG: hypothetical protein ACREU6_17720 [Steroidobacteraceae bacterium]
MTTPIASMMAMPMRLGITRAMAVVVLMTRMMTMPVTTARQ